MKFSKNILSRLLSNKAVLVLFFICSLIIFFSVKAFVAMPNKADIELVDYFSELNRTVPNDSPERMLINKSRGYPYAYYYKILKGDLTWNKCDAEKARRELLDLRKQIVFGQNWPIKKREEFSIPYAPKAPELNGNPDSSEWQPGLQFKNEYKLNELTQIASGIKWQLLWDKKYLYISISIPDDKLVSIKYNREQNKYPWDGDCIEIFIMPSLRLKTYWEIVVNPDGHLVDGLHCSKKSGYVVSRLEEDMNGLKIFTKKVAGGFVVQLKIPFTELPNYMLGNKPVSGQFVYLSLLRINNGQRYSARPLLYDGHNIFGYFKALLAR